MVRRGLCVALIFLVVGGARAAAPPDDTFQQLYGDRIRKLKPGDHKGGIELAKKLLSDAGDVADDKAFQALLCNKAYEFASPYPDGYLVATDAMELLGKISAESKAAATEKALEMYEKRYNAAPVSQRKAVGQPYLDKLIDVAANKADAGDLKEATTSYNKALRVADSIDRPRAADIRDSLREVGILQASRNRLDDLVAKAKADPDNAGLANDILHILLYEQGRAADALKFATSLKDATAKRALSLAVKDPDDLNEEQLIELAEWHEAQAAKAADAVKAAALEQALRCYSKFIKIHSAEDAGRLKAKHALAAVQRSLADVSSKIPHRTVDLLKLIDPARDVVSGTWKFEGSALKGETKPGSPAASITIRYQPPEEYDLKIEFTRVRGNECVGEILSHEGQTFLVIQGGWGNTVCGIDTIDGKRADANPSTQKFPQVLKNDNRSVVVVEVRNRSVNVRLNGVVVTHYATNYANLSLFKQFWDIGDGRLGLGTCNEMTVFHSVRLTEVAGPH